MSDSQVALAELRTVITPAHSFAGMNREQTIAALEHQASLTARNRTPAGRLVGGLGREQVMESYFAAASSGVKGEAIVPVAEQSALLGIAGQTTARQAGIYLTSMFGQWGDQGRIAAAPASRRADVAAQEVRYISDVMARTQDSFATPGGLNELGPAFARVSPIAKAMNYTLEETAVTIGVLADAGFRGALGGNKARMVMDDLDISMQRLGLQTARNADGTRSLEGSLRRIQDAGVGENEIIKAFGKMAAPGLLVMIDSLHKFDAGLKDVAGTTMENASEHAETYKNRLGNYTDALSEFQIHMGEGAGAVRTAGLEVGTTLLSVANALGPGFGQVVGGAAQIGSVVGGAAVGILDLAVGVHALRQLTRDGGMADMFGGVGRGIGATRRGFAGMFRFIGRALPLARRGIGGMFGTIAQEILNMRRTTGAPVPGVAPGATPPTTATPGGAKPIVKPGAPRARPGAAPGLGLAAGLLAAMGAEWLLRKTVTGRPAQEAIAEKAPAQQHLSTAAANLQKTGFGRWVARTLRIGMDAGAPEVAAGAENLASEVDRRMAHSDAEVGPLSTLTASGRAIPQTMAAGMLAGTPTLVSATNLMLGAARALLPPGLADAAIPAGGSPHRRRRPDRRRTGRNPGDRTAVGAGARPR